MTNRKLSSLLATLMLSAFALQAQAQEATFNIESDVDSQMMAYTHNSTTLDTHMPDMGYSPVSKTFSPSTMRLDFQTTDPTKGLAVTLINNTGLVGRFDPANTAATTISFNGVAMTTGTAITLTKDQMAWTVHGAGGESKAGFPLTVAANGPVTVSDEYHGNFTVQFAVDL
ncbi:MULTISPECIES: CS1 type fimbrial major subunit [unclassified Paludibacterium]|uniref:CS1 type fimbrial major subunit n=1 Tax=unclassified Paludibacterium TaxID=2618429 RepID=UPI001C0491A7|nr:CS1 type fimbrial major subunit [Paludibacterium sp. B53371]BEV70737.1 hypothetical protein THUN1379_02190 [Paludibacterium sp. THUN1379]